MFCTTCGASLQEGGKFCSRCGAVVPEVTAQPTPAVTSPAPPTPIDASMDGHFKVLGWLYLVYGSVLALTGLFFFALLSFLGIGLSHLSIPELPFRFFPLASGLGILIVVFFSVLSVPGIIAGYGLLKYRDWARPLTIVLSALNLLHFPFGTILGIYGLWAMLSRRGEMCFSQRANHGQS